MLKTKTKSFIVTYPKAVRQDQITPLLEPLGPCVKDHPIRMFWLMGILIKYWRRGLFDCAGSWVITYRIEGRYIINTIRQIKK